MAETLTVTSEDQLGGELTAEEQDSLQVGEKLVAAHEQKLAGKYDSAQELEKAYIQLEKKLGNRTPEPDQTKTEEAPVPEEGNNEEPVDQGIDATILENLWTEAVDNKVSKDTIDKIKNTDPEDLARMYLRSRSEQAQKTRTLTPNEANQLKGIVGGAENYDNMLAWAQQNLQAAEVNMYDQVMEKADPLGCYFAVKALAYRYQDSVGKDGKLITGKAPTQVKDQFRSQAELVSAMSDRRYEDDPAYRQDVQDKLGRSENLQF